MKVKVKGACFSLLHCDILSTAIWVTPNSFISLENLRRWYGASAFIFDGALKALWMRRTEKKMELLPMLSDLLKF